MKQSSFPRSSPKQIQVSGMSEIPLFRLRLWSGTQPSHHQDVLFFSLSLSQLGKMGLRDYRGNFFKMILGIGKYAKTR